MKKLILVTILLLLPPPLLHARDISLSFTDSSGSPISITTRPSRVVSLVPSVTEMLLQLGVDEPLVGITHHTTRPAGASSKSLVGGFLHPDLDRIAALQPDIIFYSSLQHDVVDRFSGRATLIHLAVSSIEESFQQIQLLGKIFGRQQHATEIISEQQRQLELIAQKTARIPQEQKLRTVRLMARDKALVPGDDSFQNEYIARAGGIAPQFGKNGTIIAPTLDQWQHFNPQVIYGCGTDRQLPPILQQPGWRDVDAVRNNRILSFPCDLTCRASTHTGYFVSWLAARIYRENFSDPQQLVLPAQVVQRTPIDLPYDYVVTAEKVYSDILDFRQKTLLISFAEPMTLLSSLEGWRQDVGTVGNHFFPPPSWGLGHDQGLAGLQQRTLEALKLQKDTTAMLFTGADIDNLAIGTARFKEMQVTALVTAGVKGNALRMGRDNGSYYELATIDTAEKDRTPGTINVILLTNTTLTKRAMTRGLISAVEAKSAALQDLDIRSSATPFVNPATGTGTDNIILVQGRGPRIDATGGHTKMGELIAQAVHVGVTEAIGRQNGITTSRSVFARLAERKIRPSLIGQLYNDRDLGLQFERLLLTPQYAAFITAALAISDQYERGLITTLDSFDGWCQTLAADIAGKEVVTEEFILQEQPLVVRKAIGALLSGLRAPKKR